MKIFFSLCLPQTLIQAPIQKTIRAQLSHKKNMLADFIHECHTDLGLDQ